jgi:hypothetical protein
MNKAKFTSLIKECIKEVFNEDLQRICSWCQKDMGTVPSDKTGVSHGICSDCLKKQQADLGKWQMGQQNDRAMKQAGSKFV